MKPEAHNHDESDLGRLLHEWKVEASLPPRFSEDVWRRVASEDIPAMNPLALWRQWIASLVSRPAFALSYTAILLSAGLLAGVWQAQATTQHASETLSVRYVQMLDPYQMPR